MSAIAGLRDRIQLLDVMGRAGSLWERTPKYGRWVAYLLLIAFAFVLPADAIGSFMTPQAMNEVIAHLKD